MVTSSTTSRDGRRREKLGAGRVSRISVSVEGTDETVGVDCEEGGSGCIVEDDEEDGDENEGEVEKR